MDEIRIVLTTAPATDEAASIARKVVEEKLACCVNVVPGLRSIYRWKGDVCDDAEVLLVAKVRADRLGDYAARMGELHPYDVPEIVALSPSFVSEAYLSWAVSD